MGGVEMGWLCDSAESRSCGLYYRLYVVFRRSGWEVLGHVWDRVFENMGDTSSASGRATSGGIGFEYSDCNILYCSSWIVT